MTTGRRSVALAVIDALLDGRSVCAEVFAREIKAAGANVRAVLRYVQPHVNAERRPDEPGRNRTYYTAADEDALSLLREDFAKNGWNPRTRLPRVSRPAFTALLAAWGIAPAQIALPTIVHRLAVPEDEMEEA
ncbi:hypothetical protein BKK80_34585 (plasmid) [Cupriavidus malaysiensis]|uniref:HTH merR-type domain-containing protein n=1 Tax=Cupriavidus malaysiensis TaxID=367825 RepID=A0ABN4U1C9_9BURK|nr:hypothetical protein BKK80_34585 [Cupriavidus malaysiensis]